MGYLERLSCGCVVFGKDAVVDEEDRKVPVIINWDCMKHGHLMKLMKCKICGKRIPRSVETFMEHLQQEHWAYFVDKVESIFFEK